MDWLDSVDEAKITSPHHWRRYAKFITYRVDRDTPVGYVERHHAWPKSLGGSDAKFNLVSLTAREHFIAHWMLWKAIGGTKMSLAFWNMCNAPSPTPNARIRNKNSRVYEALRLEFSRIRTGSKDSEETRKLKSASRKGKRHSEEVKAKIGASRVGVPRPEKVIEALRKANKGRLPWETNLANLSIWRKASFLHDIWVSNPKVGAMRFSKLCVEEFTTTMENIHRKFKEGWIPKEDDLWLKWKESQT